ncbi:MULTISPECIES: helix-turn-helix transcriptional regulator [unclassified Mesorhizobium]|uniref:helix-turn-helix domain-containing protein n=1 Tax=unclassified Mesorhizobium TaxID=325217 RepID=UPI000FCC6E7A|nr:MULTISPECIES: helix-turn-helix transcriptional regulator [unclassified Mesorhizobium]RUX91434.1 XRE family transcriptional regulator [Mesorhizobium sp. M7D.F.Ca.US.004.01.2.1]RVA20714.1 XRE family transcriptional regulator [Mesorhizobium sp. M7D.F.Ca.US.004.03.1.1]
MPIRENLAANLRRLIQRHASVSAVCRELGVNRTQFERYLQGKAIPNKATARLICDYFKIDENELYREPAAGAGADDGHASLRQTLYENMVRPPSPAIAGGTYFTYFSVPGHPDLLMRSVTFVRREAELVTFRRVTRWAPGDGQGGARVPGNHYGVAISRLNWIYFSGINRRQTAEPSIMTVQWAPISEPVLVGSAFVLTGSGPACVSVIMRQDVTRISMRRALQMAHVVSLDDPGVDQLVVSLAREA